MHRFALLPWVMKAGSFPSPGVCGSSVVLRWFCLPGRGGRCMVGGCRLSLLSTLGPFVAV